MKDDAYVLSRYQAAASEAKSIVYRLRLHHVLSVIYYFTAYLASVFSPVRKQKASQFPILVTDRWAEADPGVQAVSPQSSTRW